MIMQTENNDIKMQVKPVIYPIACVLCLLLTQ